MYPRQLRALMRKRTNLLIRHYALKIGAALVLAFVWTFLLAFLVQGNFHFTHLAFDLSYSFVMFLLFYEGYMLLNGWLDKRFPKWQMSAERYLLGLLLFKFFSLAVFALIGILPHSLLEPAAVGPLTQATGLRLNFIVLALVSTIYYSILTSFHVFRNIHQASLQAEKLQKEIAQAQFESLKNQVNPHFLFNSLNVLTSLITLDPLLAEKFTEQLSKAYRYVLEHKGDDMVALRTELEFIHSYIFLIDIRFKDKLKINLNIPAEKLNWLLPPLTLQLLIENAIKHNVVSKKSPLEIDIFVDQDDYLCVSNNLQIRDDKMASSRVGLRNISNRYGYITDKPTFFGLVEDKYLAKIPLLN
jgi:two-component system, LytTR family, sensor kinase